MAAAVREVIDEYNVDMVDFDDDPSLCDMPAMPRGTRSGIHRPITPLAFMNVCVARPVTRKESSGNAKAKAAMDKEWGNLVKKTTWPYEKVMEWSEVARLARAGNRVIHLVRIAGIMVEKGAEVAENNPNRKFKYLVVLGNDVIDQNWEAAMFPDLGSAPASMEASKAVDGYGSFPGNDVQQADAEQAYIQAELEFGCACRMNASRCQNTGICSSTRTETRYIIGPA